MKRKCKHANTTTGPERPYFGCVAVHPYTDCQPGAHGGYSVVETCSACGCKQAINSNQHHIEYSPWRQ